MMSYGRKLADSMKIPNLCLNIIGRNVDKNDIRAADSVDQLVEKTKNVKPVNPHVSPHYGKTLECTNCHLMHQESENYCNQCHEFNFKVP